MRRAPAQKIHLPQRAGGVVLQEALQGRAVGASGLGGAVDPLQDHDLLQSEVGQQRHRLGGQDDLVPVPARDMCHLREQADRGRVEPQLGLVQHRGGCHVRPHQKHRHADEPQGAVAGLMSQEGAVQPALLPAQPNPVRRIGDEYEVVEERRDMADRRDDALIVLGVSVAHLEEVSGDVLRVRAQVDVVADR